MTGVKVIATATAEGRGHNHCMHGDGAIIEEVLDWRPYDYFRLEHRPDSDGPIHFDGTGVRANMADVVVHQRFAAPKTPKERAIMEHDSLLDEEACGSATVLTKQLDQELERRGRDAAEEPAATSPTGWTGRWPVVGLAAHPEAETLAFPHTGPAARQHRSSRP